MTLIFLFTVELIPLAQRGRQNRKTHPRNSTNDGVELQPLEELEEDGCDDVILKPTGLYTGWLFKDYCILELSRCSTNMSW